VTEEAAVSDLKRGRHRRVDEGDVVRACWRAAIVAVAALLVASPAAGCRAKPDYTGLLLTYIRLDPADELLPGPVVKNPNGKSGVSTVFKGWDRTISDTILVFPDAATAASALDQAKSTVNQVVSGGTTESVPVGGGGTITSGRAPYGSQFVTVLLFTEGGAFTTMEFHSMPSRGPIENTFIVPVGRQQDTRIRDQLRD
jgi:hypothetical protein